MVIAKYIGDLLFDYECVVIPGLGGFIINDKPSQISYDTHYFKPPVREVMFNPYLRTNDGLLLNYIAAQENLTYQEAKKRMDAFALACVDALDKGKRIRFDKVGSIRMDENRKIVFEQDDRVNYNPNSFGLTPFISPAVRRVTNEEKIKEVIGRVKQEKEKKEKTTPASTSKRVDRRVSGSHAKSAAPKNEMVFPKRRSPYRNQMYFVLLLLFGMMIGWGVMNKEMVKSYYIAYGNKIPVFYSNPGSYIANNVEIIPLKEISNSASALWLVQLFTKEEKPQSTSLAGDDLTFKSEAEVKNDKERKDKIIPKEIKENSLLDVKSSGTGDNVKNEGLLEDNKEISNSLSSELKTEENDNLEKKVESVDIAEPGAKNKTLSEPVLQLHYFIVAGSFKNHENAERLVNQLMSEGFDAVIAGTNKYGMTRVAYGGYETMQEAVQHLTVIRQQQNPAAWISKK